MGWGSRLGPFGIILPMIRLYPVVLEGSLEMVWGKPELWCRLGHVEIVCCDGELWQALSGSLNHIWDGQWGLESGDKLVKGQFS